MKKLLLILGILLIIFIGLLIAVPYFYKDKIVALIKNEINKELNAVVDFDENVQLSLIRSFPKVSLGIRNISVVGLGIFEGDTLLHLSRFSTTLDLMSFIHDEEIRIKSFLLEEPKINALITKEGLANWDITKPSADTSASDTTQTAFNLALAKYEIKNAHIIYADSSSNMYMSIESLNHAGSGDFTQSLFNLVTNTEIDALTYQVDGIPYLNKAKIKYDCTLEINNTDSKYAFKDNLLELNALQLSLEGWLKTSEKYMDTEISIKSGKWPLAQILSLVPVIYKNDFQNLTASGNSTLDLKLAGRYNPELEEYPAINFALNIDNGAFNYQQMPAKLNKLQFQFLLNKPQGKLDLLFVHLKRFQFRLDDEPFEMEALARNLVTDPYLDFKASGKLNFERVRKLIPLPDAVRLRGILASDVSIKGNVSQLSNENYEALNAKGGLELSNFFFHDPETEWLPLEVSNLNLLFNPKEVEMSDLTCKYGHSDIKANAKIRNFFPYLFKENEILKGEFNFKSSLFDANSFLVDAETEQKTNPAPTDTLAVSAPIIPTNLALYLNGQIDRLLYDNLQMENVKGDMAIENGVADIKNLSLGIFNGLVKMNGLYDSRIIAEPSTNLNLDLAGVDIRKSFEYFNTVKKLMPIAEYLTGNMDAQFSLSSKLDQHMNPVLGSIGSSGKLVTSQAVLSGFKPMLTLADQLKLANLKEIILTNMHLAFEVANGRVILKNPLDLNLGNIQLKVKPEGYTTFEQEINYALNIVAPYSLFGSGASTTINNLASNSAIPGLELSEKSRLNILALLTGSINQPKFKLSLEQVRQDVIGQVKEKIQEKIEEKKQEVIKDVGAALRKRIADAEKRGDELIAKAEKEAEKLKQEADRAGQKLIEEADNQGKNLINEAGRNPLKKGAAQKAADELNNKAKQNAAKLNQEAATKANNLIAEARKEKTKLVENASKPLPGD